MTKKFICDGMLGKLCKLLRVCGVDTSYSNQGTTILLQARKENRIILTRHTRLRGKTGVFFLQTSNPTEQLKIVIVQHKLQNSVEGLTRCLECNHKLTSVSRASVKGKVPYFTFKNFFKFAQCPECQRVYWKGSHYKKMIKEIQNTLSSISNDQQ